MLLRCLAVLLTFGTLVAVGPAIEPQEVPVAQRHLTRLIAQLGSETYADREEARRALEALGADALEALRLASRSEDPEVRRHARELVELAEKRIETARLLAPQRLRLVYQDALLTEAVADFAKKTGAVLQFDGDPAQYADRTITLDTGETTFWPALGLFCARAGLVASVATAAQPPETCRPGIMPGIMANRNQSRDVLRPQAPDVVACRVLLTEAKQPGLPTHLAGSLRLRVVAADIALPGHGSAAGETMLALELLAEPGLLCRKVFGVRIHQAVDDQGQPLAQRLPPSATKRRSLQVVAMPNARPPIPMPAPELVLVSFPPTQIPLYLHQGERPARMLQELSGTVVALVQSPTQTLVTVDPVLKAAGQTFAGPDGSWVKVIEVSRLENRQMKLLLRVELPASLSTCGDAARARPIINKQALKSVNPDVLLTAQNFVLLDRKGRPFKAIKAVNTVGGGAQELELIYQPAETTGEAARFIYTGPRSSVVEVPFHFANVPLPSKEEPKP